MLPTLTTKLAGLIKICYLKSVTEATVYCDIMYATNDGFKTTTTHLNGFLF